MLGRRRLAWLAETPFIAASSRPSWRKPGGPSSPSRGGTPDWLERRPGPSWEGPAARFAALALLAVSVPTLIAAFIWLFPHRQPMPMLVVTAARYASPCPPNAFALEDAERFQAALGHYDNVKLTVAPEPRNSDALLSAVREFVASSKPGGPDKQAAVIYISAHGLVNGQGHPCLVLPGHNPLDSRTWLPVAELFKALAPPAGGDRGTIVLLLDANRIDDAWSMGVLANTFSTALDNLIEQSPPPNCAVITSASGLQSSVASPEISGTLFGYFAALGLRGSADSDRDSFVTLAELESYLNGQVDAWAWKYRGVRQQPRRVTGKIANIKLLDVAGKVEIAEKPWAPTISKAEFSGVFQRAEKLEELRVYQLNPMGWARALNLLGRLDAESLAGDAYRTAVRADTLRTLEATLSELEGERRLPDVPAVSLAMHDRFADPAAVAPDAAGFQAAWNAWLKEPPKNRPTGYDQAASFTWSRLAQGDGLVPRGDVNQALNFCDLAGKPARDEFTEMALLRLLARHVDWSSPAMEGGLPRELLTARRQSETLAACADPREHYLLAPSLAALDEDWALAFDRVIVGDEESIHEATESLGSLTNARYPQASQLSQHILAALRTRDQALATVVPLNQWLVHRARHGGDRSALEIQSLAENAFKLARYLDEVMESPGNAPATVAQELETLTGGVNESLEPLIAAHAGRIEDVYVQEGGSQTLTAVETPDLLRSPVNLGEGRSRLHDKWIEKLTSKASASVGKPTGAAPSSNDDREYLRWLATEGTRPLRQILDDQVYREVPAPESDAPTAKPVGLESSREEIDLALAAMGEHMRDRLNNLANECRQLSDFTTSQWREAAAAKSRLGFSRADLLCRSLAPLAAPTFHLESGEATPTERLRALDAQAWLAWQGKRLVDDCWGSWQPGTGVGRSYFLSTATNVADDAAKLMLSSQVDVGELRARIDDAEAAVQRWKPLSAEDLSLVDEGGGYKEHHLQFGGDREMRPGEVAVYLANDTGELFETYIPRTSAAVRRIGESMQDGKQIDSSLSVESLDAIPTLTACAPVSGPRSIGGVYRRSGRTCPVAEAGAGARDRRGPRRFQASERNCCRLRLFSLDDIPLQQPAV